MHHPWHELRDLGDEVRVHFTRFTDGRVAANLGDLIWLERRLEQTERRCAVQHELVHRERGYGCEYDAQEERLVRRETASRLIDTADLINACKWARSVEELADELWVTTDVLMDRLKALSPVELAMIQQTIRTAHGDD